MRGRDRMCMCMCVGACPRPRHYFLSVVGAFCIEQSWQSCVSGGGAGKPKRDLSNGERACT